VLIPARLEALSLKLLQFFVANVGIRTLRFFQWSIQIPFLKGTFRQLLLLVSLSVMSIFHLRSIAAIQHCIVLPKVNIVQLVLALSYV